MIPFLRQAYIQRDANIIYREVIGMAKSDLIGGALWEQYSRKVNERMENPSHLGVITEEETARLGAKLVVADWGAEVCGDALRLYWAVDPTTDKIILARFKTFGCGTAIASSDAMAEMCIGRTVDEALQITNLDVERTLRDEDDTPAIPPQKMHCSVMAYDAIKLAASLYKGVDVSELESEEIVCQCARVSLRTVKEVIRVNDLTTVEDITRYTKAGAFCKSCVKPGGHEQRKYYLVDILRDVRRQMDDEAAGAAEVKKSFGALNLIQKHRRIETALDEKIRPNLFADGGDIEVVDMKENDGFTEIYIKYLGACSNCPSGQTGTLNTIEDSLKKNLDESIRLVLV